MYKSDASRPVSRGWVLGIFFLENESYTLSRRVGHDNRICLFHSSKPSTLKKISSFSAKYDEGRNYRIGPELGALTY